MDVADYQAVLAMIDDPAVLREEARTLRGLFQDPEWDVRARVVSAYEAVLAMIDDPAVLREEARTLRGLFQDSEWYVRESAVAGYRAALAKIDDPAVLREGARALRGLFQNSNWYVSEKTVAGYRAVLAKIDDPAVLREEARTLRGLFQDPEWDVRARAVSAYRAVLAKIDDPAVLREEARAFRELFQDSKWNVKENAVAAYQAVLAKVDDPAELRGGARTLRGLFRDSTGYVRERIVEAYQAVVLAKVDDPAELREGARTLRGLFQDSKLHSEGFPLEDVCVRVLSAYEAVLGKIDDPAVLREEAKVWQDLLRTRHPQLIQDLPYTNIRGFIMAMVQLLTMDVDDPNLGLIFDTIGHYASTHEFYRREQAAVLDKLRGAGFRIDYLLSDQTVLTSNRLDVDESTPWYDRLRMLLQKLLGSKDTPPAQTFRFTREPADRKKLFGVLNEGRQGRVKQAIQGDIQSALTILDQLTRLIATQREKTTQIGPEKRLLEELHDLLSGIKGELAGQAVSAETASLIARRSPKQFPEVLFDNERLNCCIFLPDGAMQEEIPLIVLDPKTPLLEIWVAGMDAMQGVATQYLGTNGQRSPVVFVDTFEGSQAIYRVGKNAGLQFVLDALVEDASCMGAKEVFIYNCTYGRPLEFVSFVKGLSKKDRYQLAITWEGNYQYTAVDVADDALRNSLGDEHHYTDAFGENSQLEGTVGGYVINVEAYRATRSTQR